MILLSGSKAHILSRGIVTQESDDAGHVVDTQRPVALLPIDDLSEWAVEYEGQDLQVMFRVR
jgi:hypothetical protein